MIREQAFGNRLKEKIETLKQQMRRLERLKVEMLATPDQQISLTDPDARSMATSGRGSGVVGYNVQIAVEANHHLIVMHEVTNDGTDRSQLSHVANETKAALGVEKLDAVVSGFHLRARLDFSIPFLLSRPARNYPRLRIQRVQGDTNEVPAYWEDILAQDLPRDQELYCVTTAMIWYAKAVANGVIGDVRSARACAAQFDSALKRVPAARTIFNNRCICLRRNSITEIRSTGCDGSLTGG